MSNSRRAADSAAMAASLAASLRCPDCDSDTALVEQAPGVLVLSVMHDDTCMTLRRLARRD